MYDPPIVTEPLKFLPTFQYFSQVLFLFWDFRQEYFGIKMTHFARRQNTARARLWSVKRPLHMSRLLHIQNVIHYSINKHFCTLAHKRHTCPWVFSLVLCSTKQNRTEQNINLPAVYKLLLDCLFVCKHGKIWKCRSADNNHTHRQGNISHRYGHIHTVCLWEYVSECIGIYSISQMGVCSRKTEAAALLPSQTDSVFIWRKLVSD